MREIWFNSAAGPIISPRQTCLTILLKAVIPVQPDHPDEGVGGAENVVCHKDVWESQGWHI